VLDPQQAEPAAKGNVRQVIKLRRGISEELARTLTKKIRSEHPKVQSRIQGDQLRVVSKDKDALRVSSRPCARWISRFPAVQQLSMTT